MGEHIDSGDFEKIYVNHLNLRALQYLLYMGNIRILRCAETYILRQFDRYILLHKQLHYLIVLVLSTGCYHKSILVNLHFAFSL